MVVRVASLGRREPGETRSPARIGNLLLLVLTFEGVKPRISQG